MTINLTLNDKEYKKLENISKEAGKPLDAIVKEMLNQYNPNSSRLERLKKDPLYNIKASDDDVPSDYSSNIDKYIYNL